jgi:hypothetical protein
MSQIKNIIEDLKGRDPNEEIAISYWVREDVQTQFSTTLDDDAWNEVCDRFGDHSAEDIDAILFAISLDLKAGR